MVNDLVQSWGARIKFVDDLTALKVVPRNSPSLLNVVVDDIHAFAVNNNMRLNPRKCKSVTVDLLHYNGWVPHPIAVVGSDIEQISTFKLLGVHLSEDLTWAVHCDYIVKKNVQKRALSIIWPDISYETALDKAALSTLPDRRAVSCIILNL